MSKGFSKFIQLGIVGIWLCLISVLVYRHYISGVEVSELRAVSGNQFRTSEEWLGVYYQDRKIGHIRTSTEKIGDEYRFTQSGETEVTREGKTIKTTTSFKCLTDLSYRIKSFEFESRSGETFFKSHGELDKDNVLLVFMETDKQKKTETADIQGQPYLPATVKQAFFARGLEKGKRFSIPMLDIFSLRVTDAVFEVQDLVPVKAGSNVNTAYRLKIGDNYSWVSEGGITLMEKDASGIMYLAEKETLAKSKDARAFFDYLSLPALKANKLLSNPEELSSLKVRLTGLDLSRYPLLNEGRQVLTGDILTVRKEDETLLKDKTYPLPYAGKELGPFLSPTPFVQSDHHTIIYNAKKFVALEKNAFLLTRFLTSNLYLSMTKIPSFHIIPAMDIFNSRAGESNEHTVLFTSFARAGGMPSRMVGGLVYLKGYFYYHTWPEVWLGQWVPVDPSTGQFPADVTHIRLMEGDIDKLASLGEVIRGIKIDIMEAL
ncbi:MAG: transglutaminase domain-containing protein [Nitrospirae bacterium]|nr:transglutaminase domain-containing protein [Nitrospirota bacterium]